MVVTTTSKCTGTSCLIFYDHFEQFSAGGRMVRTGTDIKSNPNEHSVSQESGLNDSKKDLFQRKIDCKTRLMVPTTSAQTFIRPSNKESYAKPFFILKMSMNVAGSNQIAANN